MSTLVQDIGNLISQLVSFSGEHRLYDIETPLGDDKLMVESWVAREELSELYEYRITCVSTNVHIELKKLLSQQITLKIRLADGSFYNRTGWVSQVEQLGSNGGLARHKLTVAPWLLMSTRRWKSRVFQEQSLLSIIEEVLADETPYNNWRITEEAKSFLDQAPDRSYCSQYRETNFAFVSRLLAEAGVGYFFEEDPDGNSVSKQRLVLFADSTQFEEDYSSAHANGGQGIRFHRNAAVEEQDCIQQIGFERISQAEITSISGWDYKSKSVVSASIPTIHQTTNAPMPQIESCDWQGMYPFSSQSEAEKAVRLQREAADARTESCCGNGRVRTFKPGTQFTLTHSPLDSFALLNSDDKRFTLTGTLQAGVNNLPSGIKESLDHHLGPAPSHAADKDIDWRDDGFTLPRQDGFNLSQEDASRWAGGLLCEKPEKAYAEMREIFAGTELR